jgi:hypothetical protein
MKVRTVTIRPPEDVPDEMESLVSLGRRLLHAPSAGVDGLSLMFSAPEAGWIDMWLTVDSRTLNWWLPDAPDPFALPWHRDDDDLSVTFFYWLEAIAAGRSAAMGFDMEGPVGAFFVVGDAASNSVVFTCLSNRGALEFAVRIDRYVLVRDVYTALIAFWESDALNAAWSQWSSKPKWSLRSAIVEDYLATSASR